MQIEQSRAKLTEFREASSDCEPTYWVTSDVFQRATDKIPHIDQRFFRQMIKGLYGAL